MRFRVKDFRKGDIVKFKWNPKAEVSFTPPVGPVTGEVLNVFPSTGPLLGIACEANNNPVEETEGPFLQVYLHGHGDKTYYNDEQLLKFFSSIEIYRQIPAIDAADLLLEDILE